MIEDEDCDDLPMIIVNSSASDSSTFAMPSAEELASQRARELACEEELVRLRERAAADERDAAAQRVAAALHSDSSGSEGDVALAAAVSALHVQPHAAPPAPAARLWAALAPRLPPPAHALLERLQGAPDDAVAAHLDEVVASLAATLASESGEWADEEMLCACTLLVTAVLAQETRSRRAAARTLHALLDDHTTAAQISELARVLVASFPEARTRLQLSDALRSGGDAGADRLSAALAQTAILDLLDPPPEHTHRVSVEQAVSVERVACAASAWRQRGAGARYTCVQLAGRLLAARGCPGEQAARAALLAHLAPPAALSDAQRPDRLKVLVGASKLRLLFRAEQ